MVAARARESLGDWLPGAAQTPAAPAEAGVGVQAMATLVASVCGLGGGLEWLRYSGRHWHTWVQGRAVRLQVAVGLPHSAWGLCVQLRRLLLHHTGEARCSCGLKLPKQLLMLQAWVARTQSGWGVGIQPLLHPSEGIPLACWGWGIQPLLRPCKQCPQAGWRVGIQLLLAQRA